MNAQTLKMFVSVFVASFFVLLNTTVFAGPSFEEKPIADVGWSVVYMGSEYDGSSDTTTFTYRLTAEDWEKDLSHWVLAIDSEEVPLASGTNTSFGLDPTTGVYGVKWDSGQNSGTTMDYTITVKGNVGEAETEYSVKGGTYFAIGGTMGPGETTVSTNVYSISGFAYVDANGNGLFDPDEPALSNVSVSLYDDTNNLIVTVLTDANGYYIFTELQEGDYSVNIASSGTTEDFNEILLAYFGRVDASAIGVSLFGGDSMGNNFGFALSITAILDDFNSADPDNDGFTFSGTGKTIGYWKHQHNVAIRGKGRAHVDATTLLSYLGTVEGLFLSDPFQFEDGNEFVSAVAILKSTSSNEVDLLLKQLLGTELNHVAGRGLIGDYMDLQAVLIAWAEYLAKYNHLYDRETLLQAKDICDLINNSGE